MSAPPGLTPSFVKGFEISIRFKHDNRTPVSEFLTNSAKELGNKDMTRPIKALAKHWVDDVGDLRLLVQEGQLRRVGLPLRLCVWIEDELSKLSVSDSLNLTATQLKQIQAQGTPDRHGSKKGSRSRKRAEADDEKKQEDHSQDTVFVYESDFDENGIIYHIGTQGRTRAFQNPSEAGQVRVSSSGLLNDSVPVHAIVDRKVVRCVTSSRKDSWFAIDLLNVMVNPTHYTLRHYSSWDTECLRTWVLEASVDGTTFVPLREHVNDESLWGQGSTHTWQLSVPSNKFYRIFRIRMTGVNSHNHWYLALSGFEIYGKIQTVQRVRRAVSVVDKYKVVKLDKYTSDLDHNGILYYLATKGGTASYTNPVAAGQVIVTASDLMKDSAPLSSVVGRECVRCVTTSNPMSWFRVDFLDKRVMPTMYTLRHYASWDTEALRHWRFEGSVDGSTWDVLREHVNDASLDKKGATYTWPLDAPRGKFYKLFRVMLTGKNSNDHYYLALSGMEIYGHLKVPEKLGDSINEQLPKDFVHQAPLDENGVVHYIATLGHTQQWVNPAKAGLIKVTASSLMNDSTPATAVVGHDVVRCVTRPEANSWFIIDFVDKCVKPTAYMLRHYASWDVEALRNWDFQGSNDGYNWETLRKHQNDESLQQKGQAFIWPLNVESFYRMFRVLQWGPNSNQHNYLALSGFEIYGTLAQRRMSWSSDRLSEHVSISQDQLAVTNSGSDDKWQMAMSEQTLDAGKKMLSLRIKYDAATSNTWRFIIGVVPAKFPRKGKAKEWVGAHGSWGYIAGTGGKCHNVAKSQPYGHKYGADDVVSVALDFDERTIEFFKNGRTQGVAFRNLQGPVRLAVSFTGTESSVSFADSASLMRPLPRGVSGVPTWDPTRKARVSSILIDEKEGIATNRGSRDKWQSVMSVRKFTSGVQRFSVEIMCSPPTPNNWKFIVGVVRENFPLTWVGAAESWGYIGGTGGKCYSVGSSTPYGRPFGRVGDMITVTMDFDNGQLSFAVNGVDMGVAFENLVAPVYAAASMTGTGAAVRLHLDD
eukprot:TRINITY_DN67660_c9_g12_i2.p1 TRINITY_DN67660_c9_g12~~TRINITY_DN67660_c9_g12_i2.p1  ORF type:complete len:1039 (+),score=601.97 TRINITY_DN67660_c9_g12_i2:75-3191(+)